MTAERGKFVLGEDVEIQTRRAQNMDTTLASAIRNLCSHERRIRACSLLDARRPGTDATALLIVLTLESGAEQLDAVAPQFQTLLQQFPGQGSKTYILLSDSFEERYTGNEFYVRADA